VTSFTPPVRRVNRGRGHGYQDANGLTVPGVTTILDNGMPKKALINWAGDATAEYAVDNWTELDGLSPTAKLKRLKGGRYEARDAAANKGTLVHGLAERLVVGAAVPVPDGLEGYVDSYVRFLNEHDVQPVLVEATVMSHAHGYAGTLDLIADLTDDAGQRARWLLDIKTSRSGIFGETALQMVAYRNADVWVEEVDGEFVEREMPAVDLVGGVHVTAKGYSLIPLEAGEVQFRQFLYVQQVAALNGSLRDLVGEPVLPPGQSRYRLERVED
jgi:hypothetical protein